MYIIYTDGSYHGMTKAGAWAFVAYRMLPTGKLRLLEKCTDAIDGCTGARHAELEAVSKAVNWVRNNNLQGEIEFRIDRLDVYYDLTRYNTHVPLARLVTSIRDRMGNYQERVGTRWYFVWIDRAQNEQANDLARATRRSLEDSEEESVDAS